MPQPGVSDPIDVSTAPLPLDLTHILTSVDLTAYHWDLATDRLVWHDNAAAVLKLPDISRATTGKGFHGLIAPEHAERRSAAMANARGRAGTPARNYRVVYRLVPDGAETGRGLWVEDCGTWLAGAGDRGRPSGGLAYGVLRVITAPEESWAQPGGGAGRDELTGEINRTGLKKVLEEVVARTEQDKTTSAFLLVAIDNLAIINETFGFDVGDEVIRVIAQRLKSTLRVRDTIGNYSSNKFGVVLDGCDLDGMQAAATRMREIVREVAIRTDTCQLPATVSIGGVLVPRDAGDSHQAVTRALEALEKAKTGRKDCFVAYQPCANRESLRKRNITIADQVIAALDEGRMLIALQPIVSTHTQETALYECLLRMRRPDGSIAEAGEFIAVAEQLGLSRMIDRRVLELTIALAKAYPSIRLSLNVSGNTACDHHWLAALEAATSGDRALAERLTVEITETAAIDDLDKSIRFVDALQELGCRVAIDDFGAGYTSFRNLKYLGVDMVKIDGSFVADLAKNEDDRVFIEALVDLARNFEMETVAEWVDDQETAEILRSIGVTHLQGYYFGRPRIPSHPDVAGRRTAIIRPPAGRIAGT